MLNCNKKNHYYFNLISSYPRCSCNEKNISDYIKSFAIKNNLKYYQDDMYNIIVYKNGTSYSKEVLCLQAHLDMVCNKTINSNHDFENDPIKLILNDNILKADGTTLGADDGVGVAYMLAILESDSIKHPPLECIFTVQEEIGLVGASHLDKSKISGKRIICLDGSGEIKTHTTSSGGFRYLMSLDAKKNNYNKKCYLIKIFGLMGGHSGNVIGNGNENSLKIASFILNNLSKISYINLASLNGGSMENIIPSSATISFETDAKEEIVRKIIEDELENHRKIEKNLNYSLNYCIENCYSNNISKNIIDIILELPYGVISYSEEFDNLPKTSNNIAIAKTCDSFFSLSGYLRSSDNLVLDEYEKKIELLCKKFNFSNCKIYNRFPGWLYKKDSCLRSKAKKVFKDMYGFELEERGGHGGIEASIFYDKDIFSYGPIIKNAHSTDEYLDIDSFDRVYTFLISLLSLL